MEVFKKMTGRMKTTKPKGETKLEEESTERSPLLDQPTAPIKIISQSPEPSKGRSASVPASSSTKGTSISSLLPTSASASTSESILTAALEKAPEKSGKETDKQKADRLAQIHQIMENIKECESGPPPLGIHLENYNLAAAFAQIVPPSSTSYNYGATATAPAALSETAPAQMPTSSASVEEYSNEPGAGPSGAKDVQDPYLDLLAPDVMSEMEVVRKGPEPNRRQHLAKLGDRNAGMGLEDYGVRPEERDREKEGDVDMDLDDDLYGPGALNAMGTPRQRLPDLDLSLLTCQETQESLPCWTKKKSRIMGYARQHCCSIL